MSLMDCCVPYERLIGESSSSLGTSSLKNFSTVSGCHSFSEAMFLFSLSLLRLIGSLHEDTSFVKINIFHVFILTQNILYIFLYQLSRAKIKIFYILINGGFYIDILGVFC